MGVVRVEAGRLSIVGNNDLDAPLLTGIASGANPGSSGNAGTVSVEAGQLELRDGGQIASGVNGEGDGGSVTVKAGEVLIGGTESGFLAGILTGITSQVNPESAGNGGEVRVTADTIGIVAGEIGANTDAGGNAGRVTVAARTILIGPNGSINSIAAADGNAGRVAVSAADLGLLGNGVISSDTFGDGNAGEVDVEAGRLSVSGLGTGSSPGITSEAQRGSRGAAGTVAVRAGQLELLDLGEIASGTFAAGNAGTVTVEAGRLLIDGGTTDGQALTGISSDANPGSSGDAGMVTVKADEIELRGGGRIGSDTIGGSGGEVRIDAGRLLIDGSGTSVPTRISSDALIAFTEDGQVLRPTGGAGAVTVEADDLELRNGGQIGSGTRAAGDAGTITVKAGRLLIDGDPPGNTLITTQAGPGSTGDAGAVTITADELAINGAGGITSSTFAEGDGGTVMVDVGRLFISGDDPAFLAGISSSAAAGQAPGEPVAVATGSAGSVIVHGAEIELGNNGTITSETVGPGRAGQVQVTADRALTLSGGRIATNSTASGRAGDVVVDAPRLRVEDGGLIGSSGSGTGPAGSLTIGGREGGGLLERLDVEDASIRTEGQRRRGRADRRRGQRPDLSAPGRGDLQRHRARAGRERDHAVRPPDRAQRQHGDLAHRRRPAAGRLGRGEPVGRRHRDLGRQPGRRQLQRADQRPADQSRLGPAAAGQRVPRRQPPPARQLRRGRRRPALQLHPRRPRRAAARARPAAAFGWGGGKWWGGGQHWQRMAGIGRGLGRLRRTGGGPGLLASSGRRSDRLPR